MPQTSYSPIIRNGERPEFASMSCWWTALAVYAGSSMPFVEKRVKYSRLSLELVTGHSVTERERFRDILPPDRRQSG